MIRFLTLTFVVLIAVTSQQMAMARGVMVDTSGQVVLCTGQGTITVRLDRNGEIVEGGDQVAWKTNTTTTHMQGQAHMNNTRTCTHLYASKSYDVRHAR